MAEDRFDIGRRPDEAKRFREVADYFFDAENEDVNYVKAADYYSKAAEQGDAESMYRLALCYLRGLGVPEDTLLADYELTYLTEFAYASGDMRGHNNMTDFLTQFHKYPGDTLQQKAENYLLSVGVTRAEINQIRDIFL